MVTFLYDVAWQQLEPLLGPTGTILANTKQHRCQHREGVITPGLISGIRCLQTEQQSAAHPCARTNPTPVRAAHVHT